MRKITAQSFSEHSKTSEITLNFNDSQADLFEQMVGSFVVGAMLFYIVIFG